MHHYRKLVSQKAWYHHDMLGSTWKMTNSFGQTVKDYGYDAWGNLIWNSNGHPFGFWRHAWDPRTRSRFNTLSANFYTGKEYDFGVDLYHYDARAYDSRSGQFMQGDPYNLGTVQLPEEAQGLVRMLNRQLSDLIQYPHDQMAYSYTKNNP
jgi:hypothetical protein